MKAVNKYLGTRVVQCILNLALASLVALVAFVSFVDEKNEKSEYRQLRVSNLSQYTLPAFDASASQGVEDHHELGRFEEHMEEYNWEKASTMSLKEDLIRMEKQFGGLVTNVPRGRTSPHDPLMPQKLKRSPFMQGGDRMGTERHNYAETYASELLRLNEVVGVAEIGILKGSGLAIWSHLFPRAPIHGFDVDLDNTRNNLEFLKSRGAFAGNNLHLHEFDQFEPKFDASLNGAKFSFVIDGGCHQDDAIMKTWEAFYPRMMPNSVYIVEDCECTNFRRRMSKEYPEVQMEYRVTNARSSYLVVLRIPKITTVNLVVSSKGVGQGARSRELGGETLRKYTIANIQSDEAIIYDKQVLSAKGRDKKGKMHGDDDASNPQRIVNLKSKVASSKGWTEWCNQHQKPGDEWAPFVDKHGMKAWVPEKVPDLRIAQEFAFVDNAEDITASFLSSIPADSYFMKAAHASGGILHISGDNVECLKVPCVGERKQDETKVAFVKRNCQFLLSYVYGLNTNERFYSHIKPGCIFEEELDVGELELQDFKIHMFHQRPMFIQIDSNRFSDHKQNVRTPDFQEIPAHMNANKVEDLGERPIFLDDMLDDAIKLYTAVSSEVPSLEHVRVDFFVFNSTYTFAELTFCHMACLTYFRNNEKFGIANRFYGFVASHPELDVEPNAILDLLDG